jgi:hypothetical protein
MIKKIKDKNIKWWVQISSCVFLFSFILIFGYAKINFVIKGVEIEAKIKRSGESPLVEISGNAKNSIYLSLNGREIFIDKNGNFSEKASLLPGLSVISLKAKDKFGKSAEEQFSLVQSEKEESLAFKQIENEIIN